MVGSDRVEERGKCGRRRSVCGVVLLLPVTFGCTNLSTLRTAEPIGEGKSRMHYAAGWLQAEDINAAVDDVAMELTERGQPYAEIGYRRGLSAELDVSVRLTMVAGLGIEANYHLLASDQWHVGIGTGLYYGVVRSEAKEIGTNEDITYRGNYMDVSVPVPVSYRLGKKLVVYLAPKFILRSFNVRRIPERSANSTMTDRNGMLGFSIGAAVGEDSGLMVEYSYATGMGAAFDHGQIALAVYVP